MHQRALGDVFPWRRTVRTRAAVLTGSHRDWDVVDLELDGPGEGEVLLRLEAAGLCHSDEHLKHSEDARFPVVGGHEGAGVVEQVGPGVSHVGPGDHVVCSFIPVCGHCRWCSTGRTFLCDQSPDLVGAMRDGTFRFHGDGLDFGAMDSLGTFSRHAVMSANGCVPVDKDVPFGVAALLGCCVPTGWGAAVRVAEVRPGDVVVVLGCGGVGSNAVQGAVGAGAGQVVVIDPVRAKRDFALRMGATAVHADVESAADDIALGTRGAGADVAIVTAGVVDARIVASAFDVTRKGGTIVLIGAHDRSDEVTVQLPGTLLTVESKRVVGSLYGGCNPRSDIPLLARMYKEGKILLDELISAEYRLDDIRQGYADMHAGKNIRGVIVHSG
ncbi:MULTISPECIES: NDMA-dependent alcohol dehydrogenase [Streptomyces]|uniref:NDMA-dependent alcohol dehydrogenase n=1 Tax=Streptomyces edwardsiae TaxID=3075527 RepID=A0ABU2QE11_9ACTN|nr:MULTISPECIES: NDMA-dependent alcohol dehydrogenase [unclassified Streptomyces]MDT0402702.1 NDMA-dependent alcohol dehydrogenase [Streptomyces sp. DSM 41635]